MFGKKLFSMEFIYNYKLDITSLVPPQGVLRLSQQRQNMSEGMESASMVCTAGLLLIAMLCLSVPGFSIRVLPPSSVFQFAAPWG